MKKFLLALGCIALLALPAHAEMKTFSKLKLDAPSDWTTMEQNGVVVLLAPGNAAALSIAYSSSEGLSGDEIAKAMSKALGGTEPTLEDEVYSFTFVKNGVTSTSLVVVDNGQYAMFTVTDPTGKYNETISKIIDTVEDK